MMLCPDIKISMLTPKVRPSDIKGAIFLCSVEAYCQRTTNPTFGMVIVDERRSIGPNRSDVVGKIRTTRFIMAAVESPMTFPIGLLKIPYHEVMWKKVFSGGNDVPLPKTRETIHQVAAPGRIRLPMSLSRAVETSYQYLGYKLLTLNAIFDDLPPDEKSMVVVSHEMVGHFEDSIFAVYNGFLRIAYIQRDASKSRDLPHGWLVIDSEHRVISDDPPAGIPRVAPGTLPNVVMPFVTTQYSIPARNSMIRTFLRGNGRCLVASSSAVMVGRNMQRCSTIIFLDRLYNLGETLQVAGRCCRPGSYRDTVNIHHIRLQDTYENAATLYYEYRPKQLQEEMAIAHKM
jgi:hypothetical protein